VEHIVQHLADCISNIGISNRRSVVASRLVAISAVLLVLLLLFEPYISAQSMFGTLTGIVTDPSGAVVAGAAVTIKPTNSTEVRKSVTNDDGYFSVPTLPAGTYEVFVEMKGFDTWHATAVSLSGSDSRVIKVVLRVGSAAQTVTVEASATELATTDSGEKSALISSEDLQNLSLVGRNATEYLKILPGAALSANGLLNKPAFSGQVVGINGFCAGNGCNAGGLSAVTINGQSANITQDGQNTFDPGAFGAATPVNPNPDMISEVKVLTSNFSADNAKGPVVVNTNTKSGGSTFHGEGYFFARNHVMDANDHLNNQFNLPKPNDSYYYPGGNIGGPLFIPGTGFNKSHQKLFFFEAFEYYDQHLDGGIDRAVVPTAANLNGDFSAYNGNANTGGHSVLQTPISAPTAGTWPGFDVRSAAGCTITGGVMTSACIDPNALAYLKDTLPLPNANPLTNDGFNYVEQFLAPQTSWQNVVRGDYNVSDNTKFYVTWSRQRETANMPTGLWQGACDWCVPTPSPTIGSNGSDAATATFVHVFSPTMTMEARFGYTNINFPSAPSNISSYLKKDVGYNLTGIFNQTNIPATVTWGDSAPNFGDIGHDYHPTMIAQKGIPSTSADLTKVMGTHTAKFGFFYEHVYNKQDNWGEYMGVFTYASWAGSPTGNEYADMLMGIGQQSYYEQALPPPSDISQNIAAWYAQDTWKLTRRITVNYGLRFEHYAKPYTPNLGMAVFNPVAYNPNAADVTNTGVSWNANNPLVPLSGSSSRFLFFSPRFGAAIDVFGTGKTVVRGGWGKYRAYDSVQSNNYVGPAQTALGSVSWTCGTNDPLCYTWEGIDQHAFTPVLGHPVLNGTSFSASDPYNDEQPLTTSYSLTIDQQLPARFLFEASYVGNYTQFLQGNPNMNAVPLGAMNAPGATCPGGAPVGSAPSPACEQAFRPYSLYQGISYSITAGGAEYDAFQASLIRNVGWLSLQANYTFSKALGQAAEGNNGGLTAALPNYGTHWLWGVLPFDRAQVFSAAYVFTLPNAHGDNAFLRGLGSGWQISGITQIESGAQLTAQGGVNTNFALTAPANVSSISLYGTPDIPLYPVLTCNPRSGLQKNQYANPNCFGMPGVGQLGNGGMPYLPGPMYWNSDLAVTKNFRIKERQNLMLRFSAFNFMNHGLSSFTSNDSNLKLTYTSPTGITTNASSFGVADYHTGNRVLELGVKYQF
jgi:hypothetical protein